MDQKGSIRGMENQGHAVAADGSHVLEVQEGPDATIRFWFQAASQSGSPERPREENAMEAFAWGSKVAFTLWVNRPRW